MIGTTIGNYKVTDRVGAGGMGEVFRARDMKLERDVAIKVLPTDFARQPDRLSRFQREAKLLAGLNHSNIGAIYGLEELNGNQYLILEMIEGEDLSERLARGAIPMDEAVEIAGQIAEALEAAHEQGVIHRDLKPANIKITPDGQIKVLDFGLAKALDASTDSNADLSHSPTVLGSSPTIAGVILGTAGYMSPEQARGKTVDKRADVFAFGIVVYEMLTGVQTFAGETVSDTLAAVIRAHPDFDQLPGDTPTTLRRLLTRCLEKDPRRRLRDMGEARIAIEDIQSGAAAAVDDVSGSGAPSPGFLKTYAGWIATLVVVIVAIVAMTTMKPSSDSGGLPHRKSAMNFAPGDPSKTTAFDPALSRDGRYLAYISQDQLWVRDLRSLDSRMFEGTDAALQPFWSPDGDWIGYGASGRVYKVQRAGGQPVLIAALPAGTALGQAASAYWMADDRIVMGSGNMGLLEVSANGGTVREILPSAEGESDFHELNGLPNGAGFVTIVHNEEGYGTMIVVTSDLERRTILDIDDSMSDLTYSPTGHVLFTRGGEIPGIWALPFSVERLEAVGDPFLVAPGGREPSASDDGAIAYAIGAETAKAQLAWLDRNGGIEATLGPVDETRRPFPFISPDGRSVVMAYNFDDGREFFIVDVESGNRRRLTFNGMREDIATWHPDGKSVFTYESTGFTMHRVSLDGSVENKEIGNGLMPIVTPDGSQIVFSKQRGDDWKWDLYVQPIDGGEATPIVVTEGIDWTPVLSPDGRFLAYMSDESGQYEVYVTTFPSGSTRWQVSSDGGQMPRWPGDGRQIFYSTHEEIYAVDVEIDTGIRFGTPKKLFDRPTINWSTRWADGFDVTADGRRFIMAQPVEEEDGRIPQIVTVQNWFAEFEKK